MRQLYVMILVAIVWCGTMNYGMEKVCNTLQFSVVELLNDNGCLLKKWVTVENAGTYCSELVYASKQLKHFFKSEHAIEAVSVYNVETLQMAQLIAARSCDRTTLLSALDCHDFELAKKVVQKNPYVLNAYGGSKCERHAFYMGRAVTPLYAVVHEDDHGSAELLLSLQAQCNSVIEGSQQIALHNSRSEKMTELLLQHGANIHAKNSFEMTAFQLACASCDFKQMHCLYEHGADVDECVDDAHNRSLHNAVSWSSKKDLVKFLLAHGADPLKCNSAGKTPFDLALMHGDYDMINLFKKVGLFFIPADHPNPFESEIWQSFSDGFVPRDDVKGSHINVAENFIAELFVSIKQRDKVGKRRSSHGVLCTRQGIYFNDVSEADLEEWADESVVCNAHKYLERRSRQVLEWIRAVDDFHIMLFIHRYPFVLSYNCKIAFKILLRVMKKSNSSTFNFLLTYQPDLSGADGDGDTLLHHAVLLGKPKIIGTLIKAGADTMQYNYSESTFMDWGYTQYKAGEASFFNELITIIATEDGMYDQHYNNVSQQLMKNILKRRAFDVNTIKVDGTPLLCKLAEKRDLSLCALLLEHGACVDIFDKSQQSPLLFAVKNWDSNMMALLLAHGATVTPAMLEYVQSGYFKHEALYKMLERESLKPCCMICYGSENVVKVPCNNNHPEVMCVNCYNFCDGVCPLCRARLN